jgi:hypothetical protein
LNPDLSLKLKSSKTIQTAMPPNHRFVAVISYVYKFLHKNKKIFSYSVLLITRRNSSLITFYFMHIDYPVLKSLLGLDFTDGII